MYSLRTVFSRLLIDTALPFLRGDPSHVKRFIYFQTIGNTFLLSFLKTLSIGPDPEIESATSRSADKRFYLSQPSHVYFILFVFKVITGLCCPFFLLTDVSSRMGEGCCFPCCCPGALLGLRIKLRVQENIQVFDRFQELKEQPRSRGRVCFKELCPTSMKIK